MIEQLPQYAGKVVRVVGTIVDINDTILTLRDETSARLQSPARARIRAPLRALALALPAPAAPRVTPRLSALSSRPFDPPRVRRRRG
jgi:hypothetical protein